MFWKFWAQLFVFPPFPVGQFPTVPPITGMPLLCTLPLREGLLPPFPLEMVVDRAPHELRVGDARAGERDHEQPREGPHDHAGQRGACPCDPQRTVRNRTRFAT